MFGDTGGLHNSYYRDAWVSLGYLKTPGTAVKQPGSLPDLVAGLHSDPLRDWPVLLLLLSEEALDPVGFVGRL